MKRLLFLIAGTFIFIPSFSQNTFQRTFGGNWNSGQNAYQTSDGGYIVVSNGYDYSTNRQMAYLIKTNSIGDTTWTRTLFLQDTAVGGGDIIETADGNYMMSGGIGNKASLYKIDLNGNFIWAKYYSNVGGFGKIISTTDGGFVVLSGSYDSHPVLIKVDTTGNLVWAKKIGGTWQDGMKDLIKTYDGGYIMAGFSLSFSPPVNNTTYPHVYVIKTDANGDTLWTRLYGNINSAIGEDASGIQQTNDSGYIISGEQGFLLKLGQDGLIEWCNNYGFPWYGTILQANDNGFAISGWSNLSSEDIGLLKTDSIGNVVYAKLYGGNGMDVPNSINKTSDNGYIITGITRWSFGIDTGSVYLIKTDSLGNSGCNERDTTITASVKGIDMVKPPSIIYPINITATSCYPNSGNRGKVTSLCTVIGVNEHSADESYISIYPNPAYSSFTIALNGDWLHTSDSELQIFDIAGRCVYERRLHNQSSEIINESFSPGVYFVRVRDGERVWTEKLVVE